MKKRANGNMPIEDESHDQSDFEEPTKKYDNGKPKRIVKEQDYYHQQTEIEEKKPKKGKKHK